MVNHQYDLDDVLTILRGPDNDIYDGCEPDWAGAFVSVSLAKIRPDYASGFLELDMIGENGNATGEVTRFRITVNRLPDAATTCWLKRCESPAGEPLRVSGYEIRLCGGHRHELEWKAGEANGYSSAAPAKGYRSHWPWRLVQP